jgi:hypothetical protein
MGRGVLTDQVQARSSGHFEARRTHPLDPDLLAVGNRDAFGDMVEECVERVAGLFGGLSRQHMVGHVMRGDEDGGGLGRAVWQVCIGDVPVAGVRVIRAAWQAEALLLKWLRVAADLVDRGGDRGRKNNSRRLVVQGHAVTGETLAHLVGVENMPTLRRDQNDRCGARVSQRLPKCGRRRESLSRLTVHITSNDMISCKQ